MRVLFAGFIAVALAAAAGSLSARDVTDPYDDYQPADEPGQDYDFDDSKVVPWKEQQLEVPLLSEEHLVALDIDQRPPGMTILLDTETLTLNEEDKVVRYWLVTEVGGRYTNVVYEGFRCRDREYKTFAYASPRRLSLIKYRRKPEWEKTSVGNKQDFRYELGQNFFCAGFSPRRLELIRSAVRGRFQPDEDHKELLDF